MGKLMLRRRNVILSYWFDKLDRESFPHRTVNSHMQKGKPVSQAIVAFSVFNWPDRSLKYPHSKRGYTKLIIGRNQYLTHNMEQVKEYNIDTQRPVRCSIIRPLL